VSYQNLDLNLFGLMTQTSSFTSRRPSAGKEHERLHHHPAAGDGLPVLMAFI
jgi:hypothetical protein